MSATFYIPNTMDWRDQIMYAPRKAKPGDVIQVATAYQFHAAGNVISQYPGVTIRLGEVVEVEQVA